MFYKRFGCPLMATNPIDECTLDIVRRRFEHQEFEHVTSANSKYPEYNVLRNWNGNVSKMIFVERWLNRIGFTYFVMHTMSDTDRFVKHIAAKHFNAGICSDGYLVVMSRASNGIAPAWHIIRWSFEFWQIGTRMFATHSWNLIEFSGDANPATENHQKINWTSVLYSLSFTYQLSKLVLKHLC